MMTVALVVLACGSTPLRADPVEDFYRGKQLQFIIRTPVGGDYDSYSRLVARHQRLVEAQHGG